MVVLSELTTDFINLLDFEIELQERILLNMLFRL